jgi:hypothetical protein
MSVGKIGKGFVYLSFFNEKIIPFLSSHKKVIAALLVLGLCGGAAYHYRGEIEYKVVKPKPQPVRNVEISKVTLAVQEINTFRLNCDEVDQIVSFFEKNGHIYLALRANDGSSTVVQAFDIRDGMLVPLKSFGKEGSLILKDKMIFGMTVDADNNVYYIRKGVHALINGNDIKSLEGSTTATRIALLPGESQAYLYGNDNFTLANIKDGGLTDNRPSFLHNRAYPFKGGLTLVQVMDDGTVYGGGRIKPNGFNIVAAFKPDGKLIQYYGSYEPTDKDSIYNLIDMAILDKYIAVIDGFTLKLWKKDGMYLGNFNSSRLLGGDLNCAKLTVLDGKTLGILAYVRNAQTKLIDLKLFTLVFP